MLPSIRPADMLCDDTNKTHGFVLCHCILLQVGNNFKCEIPV